MKKFVKILPHLLIWGLILIVPIYIMQKDGIIDKGAYYSYCIRTTFFAILFYANYLFLIERFLFRKQLFKFIIVNIILVVALSLLQSVLHDLLIAPYFHRFGRQNEGGHRPPHPPFDMFMYSNYLVYLFIIGLSVAFKTTIRWYKDSIAFEQAKSGQLEADLRNLRSQLNPHFLFNTLNNIYSLIAIDKTKAQDSVHRLSNLLRYVLYDNNTQFVPLEKELEFTQNYIDLMKLRMSSGTKLNVCIENLGNNGDVASLMFMTLIENAFKHGSKNIDGGFIDIKILTERNKKITCTVENSISENNNQLEPQNSGIGLANLRKRLELLYPEKHNFIAERNGNRFYTRLEIDNCSDANKKMNE